MDIVLYVYLLINKFYYKKLNHSLHHKNLLISNNYLILFFLSIINKSIKIIKNLIRIQIILMVLILGIYLQNLKLKLHNNYHLI
jgi:hypothetical protein